MFHLVRIAVVAGLALFAASAAAQSVGAALLTQAVAATQAAKADYAFDLELDTSKANWRARFTPEASPQLRRRFRCKACAPICLRGVEFKVERVVGLGGLGCGDGLRQQRGANALRRGRSRKKR